MSIQVIDYQAKTAPAQLIESFRHTGFAIIDRPEIDFDMLNACYAQWADFFANPSKDYLYDEATGAGWVVRDQSETAKGAVKRDLKEFYHFYRQHPCPPSLQAITEQSFDALFAVAKQLLSWVEEALPYRIKARFDRPLTQMVAEKNTLFRVIHYPPMTDFESKDGVRAHAHEDINLITILPPGTAEGLQVKSRSGAWWPVNATDKQLVVNIGDMLQALTEHYLISTTHQVVNPTDTSLARYSMPLFLHPHDDVWLSDRYPRAKMYLNERLEEIGLIKA